MSGTLIAVLVGAALLILLVILEGKRQERKYGRASARPNLMGVGMLELQRHLQADRKVETLLEEAKDAEDEREAEVAGDPPPA
jgi:hypothetical protein